MAPAPASAAAGSSPQALQDAAQPRVSGAAPRAAGGAERREKSEAAATPEAELERIARLRAELRHEEADRALEEFRRRHPAHRIPPETWERVKPR